MKKLFLLLMLAGFFATACSDNYIDELSNGNHTCASNEIIYTTKYGYPIELKVTGGFGGYIMEHTYEDGYGRIIFDNDVVSIPYEAFAGCVSLTALLLPNSLSSIDSYAFSGCENLVSITIPDSVTSIGYSAFDDCSSLTSITIGDSVTSIGECAFWGCSSLTSVTIPDSVTSIGDRAFSDCTSLTSVTISNGVTSIGGYAFLYCTSLKEVYCKPTTPPTGGFLMFSYWVEVEYGYEPLVIGCKIYVPTASVDAYKNAEYWSDYKDYIVGYNF